MPSRCRSNAIVKGDKLRLSVSLYASITSNNSAKWMPQLQLCCIRYCTGLHVLHGTLHNSIHSDTCCTKSCVLHTGVYAMRFQCTSCDVHQSMQHMQYYRPKEKRQCKCKEGRQRRLPGGAICLQLSQGRFRTFGGLLVEGGHSDICQLA